MGVGSHMDWKQLLPILLDQWTKNSCPDRDLVTENRILRNQIQGTLRLAAGKTLAALCQPLVQPALPKAPPSSPSIPSLVLQLLAPQFVGPPRGGLVQYHETCCAMGSSSSQS